MADLYTDISFKTSKLVTRSYSTSFSRAVSVLDHDVRDAIYSIYGFVRLADEIVDTFHDFNKQHLLEKFEEKLERIAAESLQENVTSIAGVPSWNLVMLKYLLEHTKKSNVLELWPSLELFIHGGVSFIPYKEQFKKLIPSEKMHYLEAYNASEGFFAMNIVVCN